MSSTGKVAVLVAVLCAFCQVIDAFPFDGWNVDFNQVPWQQMEFPMGQQSSFPFMDSSSSSESSEMESDFDMDMDMDTDTNQAPAQVPNNGRLNPFFGRRGNQLPFQHGGNGQFSGKNSDAVPMRSGTSSGKSVGIAFAVLGLIGAVVGVSIYVIRRNRNSQSFNPILPLQSVA